LDLGGTEHYWVVITFYKGQTWGDWYESTQDHAHISYDEENDYYYVFDISKEWIIKAWDDATQKYVCVESSKLIDETLTYNICD